MKLIPLIQDLAVILGAASLAALLFQKLRQPVVLGYLVAGIIVGPYTPPFSWITDVAGVQTWAELGVIFLMFSLGLEFSFKKLLRVGVSSLVTGPLEAIFMLALGFGAARLIGWKQEDAVFLGAILSISSTTIIIRALEELGLKKKPFASLTIGILVVEDLAGVIILVALSTFATEGGFSGGMLLGETLKLLLIVASWIVVGYFTIPKIGNRVGRGSNRETLTLVSLALCLSLVVLAEYLHYPAALGSFIMGSLLAESREIAKIEELIRPLRDVFAAVFFVSIGMLLNPSDVLAHWQLILGVTVLTVFGKVISTTLGAWASGQSFATALQAGFSLAQIGEFSFVIASLGLSFGIMSPSLYSVAVSVSVITTFTTPYLIRLSQRLSSRLT